MNFRLVGAVLLIIGCSGMGFHMAVAYRKEIKMLRQVDALIDSIICDLQYRLTPLPQLLRNEAENFDGVLRPFLICFSEELETQVAPNVACCLEAAIIKHPHFPHKVRIFLQDLGKSLGKYNLHGQLRCLEAAKRTCQKELLMLENKQIAYTRCCQACCLCVGAVIALILL